VKRDGVTFDQEFARALYLAARRQAGAPEEQDDSGGAEIASGLQVLETRGLVEACYQCSAIEEVVSALLERGPVVVGLDWRSSMFTPRDVGGRAVCSVDEDSTVVGGHAVLLNGIALDEEIDGVRGFIRFKNSWGRNWGDAGHALIAIEDLGRIFSERAYLPIPPLDALGTEGRQDVAIPELGPGVVRYQQEGIGSDLWTTHDSVGYAPYADAITRGIQHPETRAPLTIGIKAPWGAGKTSLMRMIREQLEWPLHEAPEGTPLRPIRLAAPQLDLRATLTNRFVLRRLRTAGSSIPAIVANPEPAEDAALAAIAVDEQRWRPTVWFNPWMYQTGEQIWAGLTQSIIEQTTSRMDPLEREHFWLELNLKRIDEQAVRRKIYGLIVDRVLPAAVGLLASFVLGALLLAVGALHWVGVGLAGASPIAFVAVVATQARAVLGAKIGTGLSQLTGPGGASSAFVREQLAGEFGTLVQTPDYAGKSGFLFFVQTDLRRVLDLVATPKRPIVVFVDDLDRCSPSTVVQVIEAINVFLAGEFQNTIFVIAMEPEMVAAHIETAYADLVAKLREQRGPNGRDVELGWRFLEKFVQLPLALPGIEPDRTKTFLESLFPSGVAQDDGAQPAEPKAGGEAAIQEAERVLEEGSSSLDEALGSVVAPTSSAAEREALRRIVDRRLSRDNPEINGIVEYAARHLDPPNPREIKRFVNVFRFLVMIHTERTLAGLPTAGSLGQIAKLALLSTRWPSLIATLAGETVPGEEATIFELIERPPQVTPRRGESKQKAGLRGLKDGLRKCGLGDSAVEQLIAEDVRQFLSSEPVVGAGARAYL
jgi:hypothetical protein